MRNRAIRRIYSDELVKHFTFISVYIPIVCCYQTAKVFIYTINIHVELAIDIFL